MVKLIEHADVHGGHFGTSIAAVETVRQQGKICILDFDLQGCRAARAKNDIAKYFVVAPPSVEEPEKRFKGIDTRTRFPFFFASEVRQKNSMLRSGLASSVLTLLMMTWTRAYVELKDLFKDDRQEAMKAQTIYLLKLKAAGYRARYQAGVSMYDKKRPELCIRLSFQVRN